jgi:hypothetical protein
MSTSKEVVEEKDSMGAYIDSHYNYDIDWHALDNVSTVEFDDLL